MLSRLLMLAFVFSVIASAQTVKGTVTVDGKTVQLTHVYGLQTPGRDDDSEIKTGALILLTDREVPAKLIKPNPNPFDLRDAGVNGIKLEFYRDGSNYAMSFIGELSQASVSVSGSFDRESFVTYEAGRVELAPFSMEKEIGDTKFSYTVEFATDLRPYVEQPKYVPNAKDTEEAAKSPVTKAYFAFHEAMSKSDFKALAAMVVPERAEMMKDPDFKERFEMIKEFMAKDVKALRVQVNGETAELLVTGTMFDEPGKMGKVEFQNVKGKWLVGMERWGDTD